MPRAASLLSVEDQSDDHQPRRELLLDQKAGTPALVVPARRSALLRRYGFSVPGDPNQNPHQEWPRERVEELPDWIDRIFRDVFGLPADYTVALAGGV